MLVGTPNYYQKKKFSKLTPLCSPSVEGLIELSLGYNLIEPSQEEIPILNSPMKFFLILSYYACGKSDTGLRLPNYH